jgi:hypothetical protein
VSLFHDCYERRWDGGYHVKGKRRYKTEFYTRLEWPLPGPVLEQPDYVIEILRIIKEAETKRLNA